MDSEFILYAMSGTPRTIPASQFQMGYKIYGTGHNWHLN